MRRVRAAAPAAYLLVGLDRFTARSAKPVYAAGATIVAPTTALDAVVRYAVQPPTASRSHPIGSAFVERCHDARTGRLDARKIAEAYGVSLSPLPSCTAGSRRRGSAALLAISFPVTGPTEPGDGGVGLAVFPDASGVVRGSRSSTPMVYAGSECRSG